MEKGNCGDVDVAHICSKTCNVLACNQQVRWSLLLIQRPHTFNLILFYVWTSYSKSISQGRRRPKVFVQGKFYKFLSRLCKIILQSFNFRTHF